MENFKTYVEGRRLHVQNQFEGCLFYSTSRQSMSSFSEIFMGRESLGIPVSMFWSQFSPSNFYQSFESSYITFAPSKYQHFDLLGRHFVHISINTETSSRKRHHNLSFDRFHVNESFFNGRESEKKNVTGM